MRAQPLSSHSLSRALCPLPEAARRRDRQAMSQLAAQHHDLPAVMAFVRGEIGKNVADVQREVAPGVRRGDRNAAAGVAPELEKTADAPAAAFERGHQLLAADPPAIDAVWHRNAVLLADPLDPHATGVVDMSRDHADRATRGP